MLSKDEVQLKIAQLESTLKQIEANYNANIGALQVYKELLIKFDEQQQKDDGLFESPVSHTFDEATPISCQ